jgi:Cohesin domain
MDTMWQPHVVDTFRLTARGLSVAAFMFAVLTCMFAAREEAALATHSESMIGLFAIDADPQGNEAISLGPLNDCARAETGSELQVDFVVDEVPQDRPMIAFEAEIRYDPQLLEVIAADNDFLLGSAGAYSPFTGRTQGLPDSDGSFLLSVLDTASQAEVRDPGTGEVTQPEANVERGKGVLARLTLRAKASGISQVGIAVQPEAGLYPIVLDTQNEVILGERLGVISLAVGEDCPQQTVEQTFTELAAANEQMNAQEMQITPTSVNGADSQTENAAPEIETPAPVLISTPCVVQETPGSATDEPPSPTTDPSATPAGSPTRAPCTPSPSPVEEEIVDVEGSDTPLIVLGAILLGLGTAAIGGGWYVLQRSRSSPHPE